MYSDRAWKKKLNHCQNWLRNNKVMSILVDEKLTYGNCPCCFTYNLT